MIGLVLLPDLVNSACPAAVIGLTRGPRISGSAFFAPPPRARRAGGAARGGAAAGPTRGWRRDARPRPRRRGRTLCRAAPPPLGSAARPCISSLVVSVCSQQLTVSSVDYLLTSNITIYFPSARRTAMLGILNSKFWHRRTSSFVTGPLALRLREFDWSAHCKTK